MTNETKPAELDGSVVNSTTILEVVEKFALTLPNGLSMELGSKLYDAKALSDIAATFLIWYKQFFDNYKDKQGGTTGIG